MKTEEPDEFDKKIANGICISDRGVDHCPRCVDRCDASWFKHEIRELKDIAENGALPSPPKD